MGGERQPVGKAEFYGFLRIVIGSKKLNQILEDENSEILGSTYVYFTKL